MTTALKLEVTPEEYSTLLFGLNAFGLDLKKALRKRTDDGLNANREHRLAELQELADKLQAQVIGTECSECGVKKLKEAMMPEGNERAEPCCIACWVGDDVYDQ